MKLTEELKASIENCILCWLATVDSHGQPSVSPKEVFTYTDSDEIILANIASPNSSKNIRDNALVCVSFIDILIQKGFQVKGRCDIVYEGDEKFRMLEKKLIELTEGMYPFQEIFCVQVQSCRPIIAPSYFLFPDDPVEDKIERARAAYDLKR